MNQKNRLFYLDNIRAVLIFLVVFGHLCELVDFPFKNTLYCIIYSFHMPAFAFISGLCFKKKNSGVFRNSFLPYCLFQTIFLIFDAYATGNELKLQYTTPYWILWYLLSIFFWYMISTIIDSKKKNGIIILFISIVVALCIGYENTVGYYLALSRTIVLFPFFYFGVYIKANYSESFSHFLLQRKYYISAKAAILCLAAFITYGFFVLRNNLMGYFFYNSTPYNVENGYTVLVRCATIIAATIYILALFILIPKNEIFLISRIGRNTMPIFVLHAFLIKYLQYSGLLNYLSDYIILWILVLSAVIVLAFSSPPFVYVFNVICGRKSKKPIKREDTESSTISSAG